MIWELINMSDKIIVEHDDFKEAVLSALLLGKGAYGLEGRNNAPNMPIFLMGGIMEWYKETFQENFEKENFITHGVAAALRGYFLGDETDLMLYKKAIEHMTPEQKAEYRAAWDDVHRTSLSDIVGTAHEYADKITAKLNYEEACHA